MQAIKLVMKIWASDPANVAAREQLSMLYCSYTYTANRLSLKKYNTHTQRTHNARK